jgi:hypothetical protein
MWYSIINIKECSPDKNKVWLPQPKQASAAEELPQIARGRPTERYGAVRTSQSTLTVFYGTGFVLVRTVHNSQARIHVSNGNVI